MFSRGRLQARPYPVAQAFPPKAGLHALGLHSDHDALLYVPERLVPTPVPLVVLLHGARGDARTAAPLLSAQAERHGFLMLLPQSEAHTWDLIASKYGPDVEQIDAGLERVFLSFVVDPHRLAVAGFSDGASYALSLGLVNGDLFRHILAFSPGFVAPCAAAGQPGVFISHGTHDAVLPVQPCGRTVAGMLVREGFDVDFREFDGGHRVPADIAHAAAARWLGHPPSHAPGP